MSKEVKFEERPWGGYSILEENDSVVVKLLRVNPGCQLSLQKHALRSETWFAMTDGLLARIDGETIEMEQRKSVEVGVNVIHRLINPTAEIGYVIEVIRGEYQESDIVRLEDDFGRI